MRSSSRRRVSKHLGDLGDLENKGVYILEFRVQSLEFRV